MKSTTGSVFKLGNKRVSSAEIRVHFCKGLVWFKGHDEKSLCWSRGSLNANTVSRGSGERDMICWLPVCLSQHAPDTFLPQRTASHREVYLFPTYSSRHKDLDSH